MQQQQPRSGVNEHLSSVTVKLLQSETLSMAHVNLVSPTPSPFPRQRLGSSDGVE